MKESNKKILELAAAGKSAKEIAAELNMNRRTIESRLSKLRTMHNCATTAQLLVKILTSNPNS